MSQVILVLVKPGTTQERQDMLARKYGVRVQVVASYHHPELPRDEFAEEWPLRRAMVDQAPLTDGKQVAFRGHHQALAISALHNTVIKVNRVGNYALVWADVQPIRTPPKGYFGIRGVGYVDTTGEHVFQELISIDWCTEVV